MQPKRPPRTYVVRKGDTLSEIAARVVGSSRFVADILKLNPGIKNPHVLREGDVLVLPDDVAQADARGSAAASDPEKPTSPGPKTRAPAGQPLREITVKAGDTLYGLAKQHLGNGNKWRRFIALNRDRITGDEHLVIGTKLRVPRGEKRR